MKKHTLNDIEERVVNTFSLPQDIMLGLSNLTLLGNRELIIDNYMGIKDYSDCLIRIKTKKQIIEIEGSTLTIDYYTDKDMKISGVISTIQFK